VRVRSAYRYEPPLDALLLQLKFSSRLAVAPLLGTLLARALVPVHSDSLLVPVPLHRRRLAERGFNQVAEVARAVARELGLERSTVALKRTRYTPPQSSVNAHARRQLLRGVFAAEEHRVADRRIVLIDDVVTTGATAEAASEALYAAGARTVEVWTVARTPEPSGHSQ
jgi:ComF family protein